MTDLISYEKLYKTTSTGATQVWWMEQHENTYRTCSGKYGGSIVYSDWTVVEPKNLGKINETTASEQAGLEVAAKYKKKLAQGKYTNSLAKVGEAQESFFSPMLAKPYEENRIWGSFYIQPKLNGVRCIADSKGLWSRNGKPFLNIPHIAEALEQVFKDHNIRLDGELYNHDHKDKFATFISHIRKTKEIDPSTFTESKAIVEYHVYDCHFGTGNADFQQRFERLEKILDEIDSPYIKLTKTYRVSEVSQIDRYHKRNTDEGYEGSIIRLNSSYENKRTFALMKYKDFIDEEFEIVDVLPGKGNWSNAAKSVVCKLPSRHGGGTFNAGIKGTKEEGKKMLEEKAKYIGKLGTVVYQELSEYGVPLFPVFHCLRDYE